MHKQHLELRLQLQSLEFELIVSEMPTKSFPTSESESSDLQCRKNVNKMYSRDTNAHCGNTNASCVPPACITLPHTRTHTHKANSSLEVRAENSHEMSNGWLHNGRHFHRVLYNISISGCGGNWFDSFMLKRVDGELRVAERRRNGGEGEESSERHSEPLLTRNCWQPQGGERGRNSPSLNLDGNVARCSLVSVGRMPRACACVCALGWKNKRTEPPFDSSLKQAEIWKEHKWAPLCIE